MTQNTPERASRATPSIEGLLSGQRPHRTRGGRDIREMHAAARERQFVFTNLETGQGLDEVIDFIRREGMLRTDPPRS